MKKIFTLLSFAFATALLAQTPSFIIYKTNNSGTVNTATLTNGSSFLEVTSATGLLQTKLKIQNLSSTTHTYTVLRTIISQNPVLDQTGATNPNTYFCFGNTCFPPATSFPPSTDYTILGPASTTVSPYDDSNANGTPYILYLQEGSAVGKYLVRYKVYDLNNPNDSIAFVVKYNDYTNVNNISNVFESVSEVYPNPANNSAVVALTLKQDDDVKYQVFNSLGAVVYTSNSTKYPAGKHKLSIDCSNYNSGMYFVSISAGDSKITKRMVISK